MRLKWGSKYSYALPVHHMNLPQQPSQTYRRGIALVRNFNTGNMLRWLGVYDRGTQFISFINGERLEGESFRESVRREVAWNLDVDRKSDFLASKMAQLNLEFVESLIDGDEARHYHVAFYNVEVYRDKVLDKIAARDDLIWVTSDEICAGKTKLGIQFDPILRALIKKSDVIQHWESADSQQNI